MAARNFAPLRALDREVVLVFGGGTGAATDDCTAIKGAGVVSIAQTGTGLYTITLADKFSKLLFFQGQVEDTTTPDEWVVNVASEDVASAKTISITVFKGGALADLSTDEKIKFMAVLSNTSQPPTAR